MVLLHPDDGSVESWTAEGSGDKMRADFADFEPRYVFNPGFGYCRTTARDVTWISPLQRPEAPVICQVDVKVASHGPSATADLGPSKGTLGTLGRRMPSDAGMCAPIVIDKSRPGDSALIPFSSLTAHRELRSPSKTPRSSEPCCRMCRHSHKFTPFSKPTKTSGECHPSFIRYHLLILKQKVTTGVGDANVLSPQPNDLSPSRRAGAACAR